MPVTFNWSDAITLATPIQNIDFHRMFANALKERLLTIYPEGYWDEYQTHHNYYNTTFEYMAITPQVDWPINVMNGSGDAWPWDFTVNWAIDGIKLYQNALFGKFYDGRGGVFESGIVKRFIDLGAYQATGEIKPYTYATIRQQAGLNPAGFTRAKEYNTDGTPIVCGYGPIEDGDIIGPWIYEEIRRCITLLQYRKESNDYVDTEGIYGWGEGEDLAQAKNDAETTNKITEDQPYFCITCYSEVYADSYRSYYEYIGTEGDAFGHYNYYWTGEGDPPEPINHDDEGWEKWWEPGPQPGGDWLYHPYYRVDYYRGKAKPKKENLTNICPKTVEFHVISKLPRDPMYGYNCVFNGNGDFTAVNEDKIVSTHNLNAATTSVEGDWFGTTVTVPVWADFGTIRGYGTYYYNQFTASPPTFYCLVKYNFQYK